MSDRDDSTAAAWQELEPLRHTFFRHIFDPQTAETIRAFGHFLFAAALEYATTADVPEGSEVCRDLSAVAADLRYLQGYLQHVVASTVEAFELPAEDEALASRAGAWAVQVGALASDIEGALIPWPDSR